MKTNLIITVIVTLIATFTLVGCGDPNPGANARQNLTDIQREMEYLYPADSVAQRRFHSIQEELEAAQENVVQLEEKLKEKTELAARRTARVADSRTVWEKLTLQEAPEPEFIPGPNPSFWDKLAFWDRDKY